MEVDLHIHSHRSNDSRSKPRQIIERAVTLGLGAIAVTDHNSWEGAREASREAEGRILVIPGAEIRTDKGDVLALFIESEIMAREYHRVIDEIRASDGVCIIPHPGNSHKLDDDDLALADGMERFNSKCTPRSNSKAEQTITRLGKPAFSSSDAHLVREIGNGTTEVDDCSDLESLRKAILRNPRPNKMVLSNPILRVMNQVFSFGTKGLWVRQP